MPRIQSLYAQGRLPVPVSQGSDLVTLAFECAVPVTGDGTALNDIIEMGNLPAGHVPVDVLYSATDLDTNGAPAHAVSFGVLNAGKTDISTDAADGGAAWATGLVIGQAGTLARQSAVAIHNVTPSPAHRALGFKVTTAALTKAAGTIRAFVLCRATP
jgi:hypothetical protein